MTISDKFFIPHIMHYLRSFLSTCHICQLFRNDKPPSRQLKTRINFKLPTNVQIKYGSESNVQITRREHQFILCIIDEVTKLPNYHTPVPSQSEEVREAFGTPDYMIMAQDSVFMSSLMSYLFKTLKIFIKTIGPYNHKLLQA